MSSGDITMPISTTGQFLSGQSESKEIEVKFERAAVHSENCSHRFTDVQRVYSCQYARIYATRLAKMRDIISSRIAKNKDLKGIKCLKLHELSDSDVKRCIIIGTLCKHQQLRPSILKELSEEHNLMPEPVRDRFVDDSDSIVLEDELQRIKLVGDIETHCLVTGIVCGILGTEQDGGKFNVEQIIWADCQTQVPRHIPQQDLYVCFISGLGLCDKGDSLMSLQLFVDWITGLCGDISDQKSNSSIVKVIVAGNCLKAESLDRSNMSKSNYQIRGTKSSSVEAIKTVDSLLEDIASCCAVDVMPGEFDPANFQLPQQPLHKCMFPKASMYPTFQTVSNPYDVSVEQTRILGTSGQNLHDIYRYSNLYDPLDILEETLKWGHVAPTCPDTQACYPFINGDPFIIDSCPHVYFASNQLEFKTKIYKGPDKQEVRLLTIPRFHETNSCVLLNLKTLECKPIVFNDLIGTDD